MIIHASSGLRPSSTTKSSNGQRDEEAGVMAEKGEELAKLRYGDVALLLTEDDEGRTRFAVQAKFKFFKGDNRRSQQFVPPAPRHRWCLMLNFVQQ